MKYLSIMAASLAMLGASAAFAAVAKDKSRELRATGECVVEQKPADVRALLSTLPGSPAETRQAKRMGDLFTECSGEAYKLEISGYSQSLYNGRAEMAAAAATLALGARGSDDVRIASPWYASAIAGKSKGRDFDPMTLGMQEFGTCVVNAAPAASGQLVKAMPGTVQERQALAAIKPVLGSCLVQGKPMRIKIEQLRLLVAEPLYHAVSDNRAG
jgi:hypothetical protein